MLTLSPQTQIEAQIGFLVGTMLGTLAGAVYMVAFTTLPLWVKGFSGLGGLCVLGMEGLGLYSAIIARKGLLATLKQQKEMMSNGTIYAEEQKTTE